MQLSNRLDELTDEEALKQEYFLKAGNNLGKFR
jgi:hypothetical protein